MGTKKIDGSLDITGAYLVNGTAASGGKVYQHRLHIKLPSVSVNVDSSTTKVIANVFADCWIFNDSSEPFTVSSQPLKCYGINCITGALRTSSDEDVKVFIFSIEFGTLADKVIMKYLKSDFVVAQTNYCLISQLTDTVTEL